MNFVTLTVIELNWINIFKKSFQNWLILHHWLSLNWIESTFKKKYYEFCNIDFYWSEFN